MNEGNTSQTLIWLKEQESIGKIIIDNDIKNTNNPIRGIYGVFSEDNCLYVGRTISIYDRLFGGKGHLAKLKYIVEKDGIENEKNFVPIALFQAIKEGKQVSIKILERVPLQLDNYNKDMQRLASAENKYVNYYQQKDQCLNQLPDGYNMQKNNWQVKVKEQKKVSKEKQTIYEIT